MIQIKNGNQHVFNCRLTTRMSPSLRKASQVHFQRADQLINDKKRLADHTPKDLATFYLRIPQNHPATAAAAQ
jgi:hypothetical protein